MARPKKPRSGQLVVFIAALVTNHDKRDFDLFAAYDHSDVRSRAISHYADEVDYTLKSNSIAVTRYTFDEADQMRLLKIADADGHIGKYKGGKWTGPIKSMVRAA